MKQIIQAFKGRSDTGWAGVGLFAAIVASLCCITPVWALFSGATGVAATFSWLEPMRPYLIGITVVTLGFAWYQKLRRRGVNKECCDPHEKEPFMQSKLFLGMATILTLILLTFPAYGHIFYLQPRTSALITAETNILQLDLKISGMTCNGCEEFVKHAINKLPGILHVQASHLQGTAIIQYDNSQVTRKEIVAAVNATGYQVVKSGELKIK